jgi:hypothetical protein
MMLCLLKYGEGRVSGGTASSAIVFDAIMTNNSHPPPKDWLDSRLHIDSLAEVKIT